MAPPLAPPRSLPLAPPADPTPLLAGGAVQVVGTAALYSLFLSVTAFVAARNVLGDVPARAALLVGPAPAGVAVATAAFGLPPALGVALALAADAAMIRLAYGRGPALTAYVTVIHAVVSVILGTVLVALSFLIASAPG